MISEIGIQSQLFRNFDGFFECCFIRALIYPAEVDTFFTSSPKKLFRESCSIFSRLISIDFFICNSTLEDLSAFKGQKISKDFFFSHFFCKKLTKTFRKESLIQIFFFCFMKKLTATRFKFAYEIF